MIYRIENHLVLGDDDADLARFYGEELPHKCDHKGTMGCCSRCGGYEDRD